MKKILLLLALTLVVFAVTRNYTQYGDTTPGVHSSYLANYIYYFKVDVTTAGRLDSIAVYVGFGNANVKGALYDDDGTSGKPGTLIDTTDAAAISVGVYNQKEFVNKPTIEAGTYWMALLSSNTLWHELVAGGSNNLVNQSRTYVLGFPATATPGAFGAFTGHDVYIVTSVAADVDKQNKYVGFVGFKKY